MKKEKKNLIRIIAPLLILLILILLFFVIIIFILFLVFDDDYSESEPISSKDYQYLEVSPHKNVADFGLVKLNQKLLKDEFISYRNEETGNQVLISQFGGDHFECTGTCFCSGEVVSNNNNNRRFASTSSAKVLTQSLFVLLTAFTVFNAQKMSRETFREECINKYSGVCEMSKIEAEVDKCENLDEPDPIGTETGTIEEDKETETGPNNEVDETKTETIEEVDDDEGEWKVYDCKGHCVKNDQIGQSILGKDAAEREINNFGKCGALDMSGEESVLCSKNESPKQCALRAKLGFLNQLKGFCMTQSRVVYTFRVKSGFRMTRSIACCIGSSMSSISTDDVDNINCVMKSGWFVTE